MNMNKGMDPMLSSFVGDSIWNTKIIADIDVPSGQFLPLTSNGPDSPGPDSVLGSPEITSSSFIDLASLWYTERKRVTSVKTEEDEGFSDVGSSEMDTEDDDLIKENVSTISDDTSVLDSGDDEFVSKHDRTAASNFLISSEAEARRYIEEKFSHIAFVPNPKSNHREKIQYIISLSDCKEYTTDNIQNLDKKSADSARVCAKIVQNIPQRYRWECVTPEQIPCCYTIVADCKKISCRDKPPRPMNAFMIWAQGARRLINELCPKMQNAAISEALGYCWRQKPDSFKKRFEVEKVKLRRFHDYEFPAYKYKPKTKVQKAKEKEELSLSKAKLPKTATKRKRPCDIITTTTTTTTTSTTTNNNNNNSTTKDSIVRKGRCGRPKKIKMAPEKDNHSSKVSKSPCRQQHIQSEEPIKMLPTKPAIKDMLTLKILNDRRSKEMAVTNTTSARDNVQHSLGQLSPIEIESPHSSDIFDELRDFDTYNGMTTMVRVKQEVNSHLMTPSVYDTPANTPPVDIEVERLSPVQLQQHKPHVVSCASSHPKPTMFNSFSTNSSTHQNQDLSRPISKNSNNKCQLSPQASMPSLTAILSSAPHIPVRDTSRLSPCFGNPRLPLVNRKCAPHPNNRENSRFSSTDVFLSCVSELLDFPDSKKDIKPTDFHIRDSNNNSSNVFDFNNNNNSSYRSWGNYNSDMTPSLSGLFNPKLSVCGPSKIFDFNDLDTLCPDLNVPLLSDDVMSSLMNTL